MHRYRSLKRVCKAPGMDIFAHKMSFDDGSDVLQDLGMGALDVKDGSRIGGKGLLNSA